MNHFAKIAEKLSAYELDGMLLTCEANRFYACGFHSTGTDGVALVTREGNFYFTDSRYIEAAHNKVQDAEIAMTDAAHPYVDLINAAMEKTHVQKLGFEDAYMTVADYRHYSEKLHCQLVPATELLISLRQSKDEEEIQRMIAAQRIAEAALDQIVKEIRPGVTEKEIAARLQYLMLAGGAENMSFDPIVASRKPDSRAADLAGGQTPRQNGIRRTAPRTGRKRARWGESWTNRPTGRRT